MHKRSKQTLMMQRHSRLMPFLPGRKVQTPSNQSVWVPSEQSGANKRTHLCSEKKNVLQLKAKEKLNSESTFCPIFPNMKNSCRSFYRSLSWAFLFMFLCFDQILFIWDAALEWHPTIWIRLVRARITDGKLSLHHTSDQTAIIHIHFTHCRAGS